jgi:phosphatidylserine/phosphatidylglycerophosphate/cardiolipin synthase-like enzyme
MSERRAGAVFSSPILQVAGIPIRFDHRYLIMHDKFVVVDGETVETGGLNFRSSAESRKAENVLVLHDVSVAQKYGQEWDRLCGESETLVPAVLVLISESEVAVQFDNAAFGARPEGVSLASLYLGHSVAYELYLSA